MLSVICVIESSPSNVICFDSTYVTFPELKTRIDVNINHTLVVKDSATNITYAMNFSKMMVQKMAINALTSWSELLTYLTVPVVKMFSVVPVVPSSMLTKVGTKVISKPSPVETGTNIGPAIVSVAHSLALHTEYGSRTRPTVRNIPELKHLLTDVVFVHADVETPAVDFEQCIPVIAGKVHYPVPYGTDLYAVNGTKVLKSQSGMTEANLLIDFTPLGGMTTVRFSECTEHDVDEGVAFDLPNGVSLAGKTFMVVIAGRLFFDYECTKMSNTTIAFNPSKFNLNNIQLSNKALTMSYLTGTTTSTLSNAVDYIEGLQDEDHYESFIIIINNPNISLVRSTPLLTIPTPNDAGVGRMFKFPPKTGGLLIRNMTREICDYFRQFDTDTTIVTISRAVPLNRIVVDDAENNMYNIAYNRTKGNALREHSINQEDDGYVMIDIVTTEVS